jgi:DNA repair exonuclease SbcCD ATPase subunit
MEKKNNEWERNTTFKAMKSCLARIQSILESLFSPADEPVEVMMAALERLESRMRKVTALLSEERKTLREFVQRCHRLSEQSTPKFKRAPSPDMYIPEDIEEAQEIERRARRAQKALIAAAKELPRPERGLDTAFKSVESLLYACSRWNLFCTRASNQHPICYFRLRMRLLRCRWLLRRGGNRGGAK